MTQTNSQIREEWENKLRNKWETFSVVNDYYENADIRLNSDRIADFFILEISELLKSQREEMIEKIENLPLVLEEGNERHKIFADGFETARDNIINLIKNN